MFRRKKYTTKKPTLARQVAVIKKTLRQRKPEVKHFDTSATGALPDNNPTLLLAPYRNIVQGTGDFQSRIGDKISMKKFQFRSIWSLTTTATQAVRCRTIAFIYKRNPDAITTAFSTIINLYLSSTTINTTISPMAFRDWDNQKSFVTLYDKTRMLRSTGNEVSAGSVINWDWVLRIPSSCSQIDYVNNGSSIASNELIIAFLTETDSGVSVNYQYRMQYIDC